MSLTFAVNWPPPNSFTSWRSEAEQIGARQNGRQTASGTARIASPRKVTRLLYLSYGAAPRAPRCQLVLRLSAEFQGFVRDLHTLGAELSATSPHAFASDESASPADISPG